VLIVCFCALTMITKRVDRVKRVFLAFLLITTLILLPNYSTEAYPLYFPHRTRPNTVQVNESATERNTNACPPGTRLMNGVCRTPYGR
jgi:hypothetical protein